MLFTVFVHPLLLAKHARARAFGSLSEEQSKGMTNIARLECEKQGFTVSRISGFTLSQPLWTVEFVWATNTPKAYLPTPKDPVRLYVGRDGRMVFMGLSH